MLIRILIPSLTRGIELYARATAHFRCVPVAIAAERFRIANGRFPNTPNELVPAHLEKIPIDPFSGDPIRLSESESGIVIYSVGEDTVDDGGEVVPRVGKQLGRDFGVRLLNPQQRGLRFLPDSEPEID